MSEIVCSEDTEKKRTSLVSRVYMVNNGLAGLKVMNVLFVNPSKT